MVLLAWKIHAGYQSDRQTALEQTRNFAQAMSAHVLSAIHLTDLALSRSAEALSVLDPDAMPPTATVGQLLATSGRALDTNFLVTFVDRNGIGVVSSNNLPISGVSYLDRPYFATRAASDNLGLYVGAPDIGRVSNRRTFFLSRRVMSNSGKFLGVVAAPIDASVIAEVFRNALFQPTLSIALVHSDGKIIARVPRFAESFAVDVTGSELFKEIKKSPSGSYEGVSMIDGNRRIFSYQTVPDLPLTVSVGIASTSWTNGIRDDLIAGAVALGVILIVLVFSGRYALASFDRLLTSETMQRGLNEQLRATKDELRRGEKRLWMITDNLPALVAYFDREERYTFHNSYYKTVFGMAPGELLGKTLREAFGETIYAQLKNEIAQALSGKPVDFERLIHHGGVDRYFKYVYTPDFTADGEVAGYYSMATDITDMKLIQDRLLRLARIDTLTGLPNRNKLYERLAEALARAQRNRSVLGCLYLDIDHFKQVNDTYGHAGGDAVLKQFGTRLQACVRQTDVVARLAGDEFVILLEGLAQADEVGRVAAKVIAAMKHPFQIEGETRLITTSIGVVIADAEVDNPDGLLKKADAALYNAKRSGRNAFETHQPDQPTA